MNRNGKAISLFVMLLPLLPAFSQEEKSAADFVIVSPRTGEHAELGNSLYRVLPVGSRRIKLERVESLYDAVASRANVIVLHTPADREFALKPETLELLKERKVVGIGRTAASIFGRMGLEISALNGLSFKAEAMLLTQTKSELLGEPQSTEPLEALKPQDGGNGVKKADFGQCMAIINQVSEPSPIDIIACWSESPSYALITRQGNCVLIGLESPATRWTKEYLQLVSETCLAMRNREVEPFMPAAYTVTEPGVKNFRLDRRHSKDASFAKDFYFQFTKPTRVHLKLEHAGSTHISMVFSSNDYRQLLWDRQNAVKGEPIQCEYEVTDVEVDQTKDGYWRCSITNFDHQSPADCKLIIRFEDLSR